MFCAVSGWAFPRKLSSCVAVATLNWLPVEALLISFEGAHGGAELASVPTRSGDAPTVPLYRQVGCCWTGASQATVGGAGGRGARLGKGCSRGVGTDHFEEKEQTGVPAGVPSGSGLKGE